MEETVLRVATLDDVDVVYTMICELEGEELDKNVFDGIFKENLSKNDIHCIVAEHKGKIVGFINLYIRALLHHGGNVAEIQELYVDSTLRGGGVGTKLITYAKRIAQENKCKIFEVTCNLKREKTHTFYEKTGFSKTHFKFTDKLS